MRVSVDMINERATTGTGVGRRKGARRAWLALPVAAVLVMSGCSSDDDKKDDKAKSTPSASAPAAPAATTPAPAASTPAAPGGASSAPPAAGGTTLTGEEKKVADNWDKLFDNATPLADRKAVLENSAQVGTLVETLANDPLAKQVTSKTTAVKISGDKAAVSFDILLAGNPALPGQTGQAVKQDGTWKVSLSTVCTLVSALKPGTVVEGCPKA